MKKLVFWTNHLAIHQSALMRAVSDKGWKTTIVVAEAVSKDRQALGWGAPDFGTTKIVSNPGLKIVQALLKEEPQDTVHVFGSVYDYLWGWYALFLAAWQGNRMGLMSEASDPDGWRAIFRWLKGVLLQVLLRHRIQFILAMGSIGVRWFKWCGYPTQKVFPFGYFVEQPLDSSDLFDNNNSSNDRFKLIYIGQLIHRKQVDVLIQALDLLLTSKLEVDLTIVGDGPEKKHLEELANKLLVEAYIHWVGSKANKEIGRFLTGSDLLILPSRFDGWGAVVNESLMAGIPVICTDHCGAKDLLGEIWRGEIILRNDVISLTNAIRLRISNGPLSIVDRQRIRNWSKYITGESASQYLQDILDHVYYNGPYPIAPWLEIK